MIRLKINFFDQPSILSKEIDTLVHSDNFRWWESKVVVASYLLGTSVPNFGAPLGIVMVAPAPAPVGPAAWLPGLLEGLDSTLPQD